jgi:hypothetical protein
VNVRKRGHFGGLTILVINLVPKIGLTN